MLFVCVCVSMYILFLPCEISCWHGSLVTVMGVSKTYCASLQGQGAHWTEQQNIGIHSQEFDISIG